MGKTKYLHEVSVTLRPYPWWDCVRIILSLLVLGHATFSAELADVRVEKESFDSLESE